MRNKIFLLLAFVALLGFSCNKADDPRPGFDLLYQEEFVIPAGIGVFDVHHFQIKNIASRYQQSLDQQGKTDADITGVLTEQAALSGIFGDADFSFIEKISVRIYNESDPSDYVEIAYRDPTPLEPGNSLPLIPSLADAKRFIKEPRFSLDVVLWLRNTTQFETETRLNLQMKAAY
jgi:hypothetical protein